MTANALSNVSKEFIRSTKDERFVTLVCVDAAVRVNDFRHQVDSDACAVAYLSPYGGSYHQASV